MLGPATANAVTGDTASCNAVGGGAGTGRDMLRLLGPPMKVERIVGWMEPMVVDATTSHGPTLGQSMSAK